MASEPQLEPLYMGYEDVFDHSYERVKDREIDGKRFFGRFYELFVDASPEIAQHFKNTDMQQQLKMMEKSFYSLFIFYATQNANDYLEKIAHRHSNHDLQIRVDLFDVWLENLVKTVREYDPQFNEEVALAWRVVLSPGITYMKFKFKQHGKKA